MYVESTETYRGQPYSKSLVSIMAFNIYLDSNNGSWGMRGGTWTRLSERGPEEIYLFLALDGWYELACFYRKFADAVAQKMLPCGTRRLY